jgi:hypothetical protein
MAKKAWKSKIEITNGAVMVLSIMSAVLGKSILPIPPQIQIAALAIINIILRFVTNEPITIKPGNETK